ncbi:MAG TPA: xanthine phosphoribosyltransferase [Candidatus Borkfalkia stercoripullorum]|nr:xanthine phosphoribosyltransferase [Candidatus Borkfalkia stercoripullorum]
MKALEDKILKEGTVLPGNVLKVGSFLNQQMDSDFIMDIGREIARLYEGERVTRILTVESSGIAIAVAAGIALHVPSVFAKKHKSANMPKEVYTAPVYSYTHKETYEIAVAKEYIGKGDKVLIVDDFLANGNAVRGLIGIIEKAGADLAGCAIAIEKGFQGAGDELRAQGIRVDSLAIVDSMDESGVIFRAQ